MMEVWLETIGGESGAEVMYGDGEVRLGIGLEAEGREEGW